MARGCTKRKKPMKDIPLYIPIEKSPMQKNSVDKKCWGCKWYDTTFMKGCTNPYFCTDHNKYKQKSDYGKN